MKLNKIFAGISALAMLAANTAVISADSVEEEAVTVLPVVDEAEDVKAPEAPVPPVIDEEAEAAKRAEREAKRAEDEAKREAEKAEREAKHEAEKAEREAKRAEDEAKREAEKAEHEANKPEKPELVKPEKPEPPVPGEAPEKPEPPVPGEKPEAPKAPHCHKIDELISLAVDQVYDATADMTDAQIVSITSVAVPLIRSMDKEDVKELVKEVLADGVIDSNDLLAIKAKLAETNE